MSVSSDPEGAAPETNASPVLADLCGTILEGRYELGRILGAGGMGAVFEAKHLRLDRFVAIKVLRPTLSGEGEYNKRFLREAKAASKIRHRNVVEILDYGEASGGLLYSVMEFLIGQDLEQLLRVQPRERLSWPRACDLLVQISNGLRAAHACGVIHRDIKPANCFLTEEDGEPLVKLVDFGIAKVEETEQTQQLTGTAQVLGTPSYIAPELVRTKTPASPRSDIYSLGVLAYRMLTGRAPFLADTVFEILRRSCFDPVPSLREFVSDLPKEVDEFIMNLLAKAPEERPADMSVIRQRLLELRQGRAEGVDVSLRKPEMLEFDASPPMVGQEAKTPLHSGSHETSSRTGAVATVRLSSRAGEQGEQGQSRPNTGRDDILPPPGDRVLPSHDFRTMPVGSHETVPSAPDTTLRAVEPKGDRCPPQRRVIWRWSFSALGLIVAMVTVLIVVPTLEVDRDVASREVNSWDDTYMAFGGDVHDSPQTTADAVMLAPADGSSSTSSSGGYSSTESSGSDLAADADKESVRESPASRSRDTPKGGGVRRGGPPSDSTGVKRLRRMIKAQCSPGPDEQQISVSFLVNQDGKPYGIATNRRDEAGTCAVRQVEGAKFRTRSETTPFKIHIE